MTEHHNPQPQPQPPFNALQPPTTADPPAASDPFPRSNVIHVYDSDLPEDFDSFDKRQPRSAKRPSPHSASQHRDRESRLPPVEPFQPFPTHTLPSPVQEFVESGAQTIGCDASYLALPLLAALASAIGNSRRLQLKRGWSVPAIVWSAIVGHSGSAKSPAFNFATKPFRDRQTHALESHAAATRRRKLDFDKRISDWLLGKLGDTLPPERTETPPPGRFLVHDATLSALAPLLAANPRGLLLAHDELAAWVAAFDRPASRRRGADGLHWFAMHNGENILVDRQTGKATTIVVPRASVSVTGGLQPATLQQAIASGLAARLLLSWPPPSHHAKRWTSAEHDPRAQADMSDLIERLYALEPATDADGKPQPVLLQLSPQAQALWAEFYNAHAQQQRALAGELLAAWSKLEEYAARLALVVHCLRCAADPAHHDAHTLATDSLAAGIELAQWFKSEARRVYALAGESDTDRARRELLGWIERKGGSVTAREVQRMLSRYSTAGAAEAALDDLLRAGAGAWESLPDGQRGGRPTRQFRLRTGRRTSG